MKGNYRSMLVANYIVNSAIDDGRPVSNLKLQKLLYYVQAASLVEMNKAMFSDSISAWKYGPVVETVYHAFKYYVNKPIDKKDSGDYISFDNEMETEELSKDDMSLIDKVVESYKSYTPLAMVKKTHDEEPWCNAYNKFEMYIRNEDIKKFYEKTENRKLIYG